MEKAKVLETVKREKLVPVVRTTSAEDAKQAIEALILSGIKIFEITLTTPNAVKLIKDLSANPNILIGAGTVLTPESAAECIEAGAKFIVSPAFNAETVKLCNKRGVAVMPGSLTPTEVLTAWQTGADVVKIFPADSMGGAKYLKALKSVFPHIEIMPTGGVSLDTIADLLKTGVIAVGVGADLVDFKAIKEGNLEIIAEKARKYLEAVNNY